MKKFKKVFKWVAIVVLGYFLITTLYFGYDDIDSEKGVFRFYWSGLRGLSKDSQFGFGKPNQVIFFELPNWVPPGWDTIVQTMV